MFSELEEGQTLRELSPLNRSLKQKEGAIVEWGSEPLSCCMTFKVLFYFCPRKKENKNYKTLGSLHPSPLVCLCVCLCVQNMAHASSLSIRFGRTILVLQWEVGGMVLKFLPLKI